MWTREHQNPKWKKPYFTQLLDLCVAAWILTLLVGSGTSTWKFNNEINITTSSTSVDLSLFR